MLVVKYLMFFSYIYALLVIFGKITVFFLNNEIFALFFVVLFYASITLLF